MSEEANKVEALLFSSGRKMDEVELCKLTKMRPDMLKSVLEEIKRKHEGEGSPLVLFNEGSSWKLMTKEKYFALIQNVVTETELDKSLMETLAVIAWKYPILQADVIRLRNNKAYDHLRELEEAGFISREKNGRTRSIRLTPKFFEYFDLPPSKAKTQDAFKELVPEKIRDNIEKTESDIEATEKEIESRLKKKEEVEQKFRVEKERKKKEEEVDIEDDSGNLQKLEVYELKEESPNPFKNKIGVMDVYGGDIGEPSSRISESAVDKRVQEIEKEVTSPEVEKEIKKILHLKDSEDEGSESEEQAEVEEESEEVKEEEQELMPENNKK